MGWNTTHPQSTQQLSRTSAALHCTTGAILTSISPMLDSLHIPPQLAGGEGDKAMSGRNETGEVHEGGGV